jgi:cytochrome c peroxidase
MNCPHCHSSTNEREGQTVHGFRRFRCRELGGQQADRHALNQVMMDIMFLGVFWKLRCKLSLRDL